MLAKIKNYALPGPPTCPLLIIFDDVGRPERVPATPAARRRLPPDAQHPPPHLQSLTKLTVQNPAQVPTQVPTHHRYVPTCHSGFHISQVGT